MKKIMMFAAIAVAALSSCSNSEVVICRQATLSALKLMLVKPLLKVLLFQEGRLPILRL